ncbi:MAG TPA: glycosyltransferase [Gemmatimonadaceae bacterium]|nr:glycosyltransferase [Gemmatimonadaceae bacterium]
MRVAAHNGARIWGGAERATVVLLRGLKDRGHEVLLFCNDNLVAEKAEEQGIPARICSIGGDLAVHHSFRLATALRAFTPDVFIVGTYKKLFFATLAAHLAGVPNTIARVGLESDIPRSFKYRIALRKWTDTVVVNARRMIEPFANLEGVGPKNVLLIHNGVRLSEPANDGSRLREKLGIPQGSVVIGTVARLAQQKRIDRLLEATALLPGRFHLLIAGDGELRQELEALSQSLGVAERVRFLGQRDDVNAVLATIDIFVVTSDKEGLSNAMLEALANGIPVISTDVSGAREALESDETEDAAGMIADFTPRSIATALTTLADDPALLEEMRGSARRRAENRFSLDTMLDKWEAVLGAAANSDAGAPRK